MCTFTYGSKALDSKPKFEISIQPELKYSAFNILLIFSLQYSAFNIQPYINIESLQHVMISCASTY